VHVDVNGTRLWFDVDGPALVPDGPAMRERPTLVLVHGGPGSYDHSYFKPDFGALTDVAQVVYLDLRDHGRSAWGDATDWTFELCADDIRAFCDALGIVRPIVLGHSMGGFVVILYAARHPAHAGGIVLQSTMARFDLDRLTEGFRRLAGDRVAELARREYDDDPITADEWALVYAAFGPNIPSPDALARRRNNPAVGERGSVLFGQLDIVDQLPAISSPTLVSVGALDTVTAIDCAEEIVAGLRPGVGSLGVLQDAGHFPWLDVPDRYFDSLRAFIADVAAVRT